MQSSRNHFENNNGLLQKRWVFDMPNTPPEGRAWTPEVGNTQEQTLAELILDVTNLGANNEEIQERMTDAQNAIRAVDACDTLTHEEKEDLRGRIDTELDALKVWDAAHSNVRVSQIDSLRLEMASDAESITRKAFGVLPAFGQMMESWGQIDFTKPGGMGEAMKKFMDAIKTIMSVFKGEYTSSTITDTPAPGAPPGETGTPPRPEAERTAPVLSLNDVTIGAFANSYQAINIGQDNYQFKYEAAGIIKVEKKAANVFSPMTTGAEALPFSRYLAQPEVTDCMNVVLTQNPPLEQNVKNDKQTQFASVLLRLAKLPENQNKNVAQIIKQKWELWKRYGSGHTLDELLVANENTLKTFITTLEDLNVAVIEEAVKERLRGKTASAGRLIDSLQPDGPDKDQLKSAVAILQREIDNGRLNQAKLWRLNNLAAVVPMLMDTVGQSTGGKKREVFFGTSVKAITDAVVVLRADINSITPLPQ